MTIRTAILRGSLALVFGSILLGGVLSFYEFREALQSEIARALQVTSTALLERIDTFLFDRLEDVREWRALEVMQDIRVGDVDERLARLLSDLEKGHGPVYESLFCTDLHGHVVAATSPALVGTRRLPRAARIRDARAGGAEVVVEAFDRPGTSPTPEVVLRTPIPDAFGPGQLGYLYAVLNWAHIERFLREATADTPQTALLMDRTGRIIGSAGSLSAVAGLSLADWMDRPQSPRPDTREGTALGAGKLLVGTARLAPAHRLSGFDWHLLIVEPTQVAFAPVWRLAWTILAVLFLTMAVAGWMSYRLSARIARPIARLTDFARRLRGSDTPEPPRVDGGIAEVRELARAFAEMIEALTRSREHLVRAGKLAVVGEMAAIMAHEVRTPLGILRSSAQLLERRPELSTEGRELTAYIVSETDRLGRLVTTLLETARPRPPAFGPNDPVELLDHVLALMASHAEKKGVHLESRYGEHAERIVSCDREQLIQVFLNLVLNAIQFAPADGRVAVSAEVGDAAIAVNVDDDGPGIPPQFRARVFDPFFTQREGGIGLGLTVVQQIVQAHGGEIAAGDSPLGGTRFTVRLPTQMQGVPA